jgi:hypothetical protein
VAALFDDLWPQRWPDGIAFVDFLFDGLICIDLSSSEGAGEGSDDLLGLHRWSEGIAFTDFLFDGLICIVLSSSE